MAAVLCACAPAAPTATPARTPTPVPSATPTPSPPPDTERVSVLADGVGAFDLVAFPVAVLHSEATRLQATGVVVHFSTSRRGAHLDSLDSEAVILYPGQSLIVTANCTDTCDLADGVTETVSVAAWVAVDGTPVHVDAATYACGGSCRGRGYGDATATIHGDGLPNAAPVDVFAACMTGSGAIVGGGERTLIWPQAGGTATIDVPVILSAQPSSCTVNATPASSTATPAPAPSAATQPSSPPT